MSLEMYARDVEEAATRLRELRLAEREDLVLAALVLSAAVVTTQFWPTLAFPLFLGGAVVGALGIRALWRRWDLVDRLTGERDAYAIPEVRECATREATIERRRSFAATLRNLAPAGAHPNEPRLDEVAEDLEALAGELEDDALELDPASAVACLRLLTESGSPLFDERLRPEEVRARIRHIRAGFTPRDLSTSAA